MYMNTRELVYTLPHITHCTTQVEDRRDHVVKGSKLKNETQLCVSWKSKCQIKGRKKSQVKIFFKVNNSSIWVLEVCPLYRGFCMVSSFQGAGLEGASSLYYIQTVRLQASIGMSTVNYSIILENNCLHVLTASLFL